MFYICDFTIMLLFY